MTKEKTPQLRIVFMGTPEFAVPSMERLLESGHEIATVVTAPDRPAGRGLQISQSPVKQFAVRHNIPVLQPEKLKDPFFIEALRSVHADIFVVVAFRMLPEAIWSMPPKGTINLHGSLLPRYRGAAPINRAVMNGETETGVTTFFLQAEIDTGNVIDRRKVRVGENESAGELHDRMMMIGADCLADTVDLIATGKAIGQPQDQIVAAGEALVHASKIFRDDCRIDWEQSVDHVHNHVRGLSPYPAAWTIFEEKTLKVYQGKKEHSSHDVLSGIWETDGKSFLRFACSDGWYYALRVQLEGKKTLNVDEFLRGWKK